MPRRDRGTARSSPPSVVVATHYPMLRPRPVLRAPRRRSAPTASPREVRGAPPTTMSISAGSTTRSLRAFDDLLIVGGEGHATGAREARPERYERAGGVRAPSTGTSRAVTHRWSAQDPVPYDHLPMIGPLHARARRRLWVATGFMKWGLTTAPRSRAMILRDLIAGRDNPWARRVRPRTGVSLRLAAHELGQARREVQRATSSATASAGRGSRRATTSRRARRASCATALGKTGVYRDDDGDAARRLAALHPPRLPAALQRRRAQLGLPVPRLALRRRRRRARGPGGRAARAALGS